MSEDTSKQPESPPPAKGLSGRDLAMLLGGGAVVAAAALALYLMADRGGAGTGDGGASATSQPATGAGGGGFHDGLPELDGTPIELTPSTEPVVTAALVDVYAPAKLRQAMAANAWLKELAASPLYDGFLGSWQGFLGTRGEDLGDRFSGTMFDLVSEKLLGGAFRVVLFGGAGSARTPAVVLQAPSKTALDAFELLDELVQRGSYQIAACPGAAPADPDAGSATPQGTTGPLPGSPDRISRWLVADHALYAGRTDDRIVLASQPLGVVQGACAELPAFGSRDGVDVEVELRADAFGRGAQALHHLLGMDSPLRVALAIEGERLVPRGLRAERMKPIGLQTAALDERLLKLVPADVEVLATLQLELPTTLDAESLKAQLGGGAAGPRTPRQIALVWTPHGTRAQPTEVAIVWSRVEDAEALGTLFSGGNALSPVEMCDALVLSSTEDLRERLSRTCHGQAPSVLAAAPAVVSGLRAPQSLGLTVNLGRVLWGLTEDAYRQEAIANGKPAPGVLPAELDAAARLLQALPILGFTGVLQGSALQPGGFRS